MKFYDVTQDHILQEALMLGLLLRRAEFETDTAPPKTGDIDDDNPF